MKLIAFSLLHWLALTSYASATTTITKLTANYDNFTVLATGSVAIDTYEFINYTSFAVIGVDPIVGAVATNTPPNAIVTNLQAQGTTGTPSLTVAKPYTSFGLTDFWFGCEQNTLESAANLASQCSVTVAAFDSSNEQVALAVFEFTPPTVSVTSVSMVHATMPSEFLLPGIKNVTIVQNPTILSLLVDTTSYYLYE